MYVRKYSRRAVTMKTLWVCLVVVFISQTATSMVIAKDSIDNATRLRDVAKEGVGGKPASYHRARLLPVAIPVSSAQAKLGESNELEDENLENPHRVKRVRREDDDVNDKAEGYSSDYAYEEIVKKSYKKKRLIFYTTVFCWVCWVAIAISILKALLMMFA